MKCNTIYGALFCEHLSRALLRYPVLQYYTFLIWENTYNVKFTIVTIFKDIVQWH